MNPTDTDRFLFEIRTAAEGGADIRCYDVLRLLDLVQRLSSPTPSSSHDSVSPASAPGAGDVGGLGVLLAQLGALLENAARIHDPGHVCRHHLVLDATEAEHLRERITAALAHLGQRTTYCPCPSCEGRHLEKP